jgi:UDP-N-acetyl-D-mannosaminuronate dehydrogenase
MRKEPRCSEFRNISILGLGKLGTVAAGCYASRGFRVIGADTDQNVVDSCNSERPRIQEPGHWRSLPRGELGSPSGGA